MNSFLRCCKYPVAAFVSIFGLLTCGGLDLHNPITGVIRIALDIACSAMIGMMALQCSADDKWEGR